MEPDHQQLEACERRAWTDLFEAAPEAVRVECGLHLQRVGSGLLTLASNVDVLAFNRAFGLGLGEPATERILDETIEQSRSRGVPRFFLQLMPGSSPKQLIHWILRRGFTHYNNWVKLSRSVDQTVSARTSLRVATIGREEAATFGTIVARCFDWPEPCAVWVAGTVGRQKWTHWMAYDGDRPVATGALFVDGDYGWGDLAATLPEARGRGAQSALMAARISQAADQECRWLVVETAQETPEKPAASYRNMRRLGFEVAYVRPNYLYLHA